MMLATEDPELNKRYSTAATKYFKEAISKNQAYSVAYYNFGMLLFDEGAFKEAVEMFTKAKLSKEDFYSADYAMFKALYRMDQKKGLKFLEETLASSK